MAARSPEFDARVAEAIVDSAAPASYGYPRQPRMWTDPPAEGCVVLTFDETWGDE